MGAHQRSREIKTNCTAVTNIATLKYKALKMVRVGVVGYGHLGQYLVESITKHQDLDLAWVWNRSPIHGKVEEKFILEDLADCAKNSPDVIVEVAHPDITR